MKRIDDIAVSDAMYNEIVSVRKRGSKCYLTRPDPKLDEESWSAEFKDLFCVNCEGAGNLGLQVVVGGPYGTAPTIEFKGSDRDTPPRATFIDGKWYKQKTREYTCPICHGSGTVAQVSKPTTPLAF